MGYDEPRRVWTSMPIRTGDCVKGGGGAEGERVKGRALGLLGVATMLQLEGEQKGSA